MQAELIENRLVVWNIDDSRKLFSSGFFGKPIGIPKPRGSEFDVPIILDLLEGYYLAAEVRNPSRQGRKEDYPHLLF